MGAGAWQEDDWMCILKDSLLAGVAFHIPLFDSWLPWHKLMFLPYPLHHAALTSLRTQTKINPQSCLFFFSDVIM